MERISIGSYYVCAGGIKYNSGKPRIGLKKPCTLPFEWNGGKGCMKNRLFSGVQVEIPAVLFYTMAGQNQKRLKRIVFTSL